MKSLIHSQTSTVQRLPTTAPAWFRVTFTRSESWKHLSNLCFFYVHIQPSRSCISRPISSLRTHDIIFLVHDALYCCLYTRKIIAISAIVPIIMAYFRATSLQQRSCVIAGNYFTLYVTCKQGCVFTFPYNTVSFHHNTHNWYSATGWICVLYLTRFDTCFTFDIKKVLPLNEQ